MSYLRGDCALPLWHWVLEMFSLLLSFVDLHWFSVVYCLDCLFVCVGLLSLTLMFKC